MQTLKHECVFGFDIKVPVTLRTPSDAPWQYSNQSVGLELLDASTGYTAVADFSLQAVGSQGLHLLTVPVASVNLTAARFALLLYSPTNAFEAREVQVSRTTHSLDTVQSSLNQALGSALSTIVGTLTNMLAKVQEVLVKARYSRQKTYNYSTDGKRVVSIITKYCANDSNPDFSAPDSTQLTEYSRGVDGRATGSVTKEVV